jgi:hypothetical protein
VQEDWLDLNYKKLFKKLVERGVALDSTVQKQLRRYKAAMRERVRATGHADAVGTFGQLVQIGDRFTKQQIVARGTSTRREKRARGDLDGLQGDGSPLQADVLRARPT